EQPVDIEERLSFTDISLSLDKVREVAMTYRPDLKAAQMRIKRSEELVDGAKALRYPDLTAGATYQQIPDYTHDNTFGVNLGLPLPIFNRNQGGIMRAETELEKAKTDNQLLIVNIVTEIENAFRTYKTKRELVKSYGTIMGQAEKALDIAVYKYRQGASSLLELLEAQRTYYRIKGDYNKALLDYQLSLEQIKLVTGH
ncbi:MAG TPA: TolC family protein, partial [Candidatus Hypogeohydataceae bacterium YC40]